MAKDPVEKARQKLARAQVELHLAQERRSRAQLKGEQEIERARERASRRLTRATERLERRAAAVARAEAKLVSLAPPSRSASVQTREWSAGTAPPAGQTASTLDAAHEHIDSSELRVLDALPDGVVGPETVADALEQVQDQGPEAVNGVVLDTPHDAIPLNSRERRALSILMTAFGDEGATSGEWQHAADMPETTFLRARRSLMSKGLVASTEAGARGARYVVTDSGRKFF